MSEDGLELGVLGFRKEGANCRERLNRDVGRDVDEFMGVDEGGWIRVCSVLE